MASRSIPQEVRAGLAEIAVGNIEQLKVINKDVMGLREVTVYVPCERCKSNGSWSKHAGKSMKVNPATILKYDLELVMKWAKFLGDYGIGKPPEEKQVDVAVRVGRIDELEALSNEELEAIRDGRALPAG